MQQKTRCAPVAKGRGEAREGRCQGAETVQAPTNGESPSSAAWLMEAICEPVNLRQALKRVKANNRVMTGLTHWLSRKLKLKVNAKKSAVARPDARKFLGYSFRAGRRCGVVGVGKAVQNTDKGTMWIRRRLRTVVWKQWKTGGRRYKELRSRGIGKDLAAQTVGSCHKQWRISCSPALNKALPNSLFIKLGLPEL